MGVKLNEEEAEALLLYCDEDKNGSVQYPEFLRALKGIRERRARSSGNEEEGASVKFDDALGTIAASADTADTVAAHARIDRGGVAEAAGRSQASSIR